MSLSYFEKGEDPEFEMDTNMWEPSKRRVWHNVDEIEFDRFYRGIKEK